MDHPLKVTVCVAILIVGIGAGHYLLYTVPTRQVARQYQTILNDCLAQAKQNYDAGVTTIASSPVDASFKQDALDRNSAQYEKDKSDCYERFKAGH